MMGNVHVMRTLSYPTPCSRTFFLFSHDFIIWKYRIKKESVEQKKVSGLCFYLIQSVVDVLEEIGAIVLTDTGRFLSNITALLESRQHNI